MPAVLVTEPTATQNSPFLPQRRPKPPPVLSAPIQTEGWPDLVGLGKYRNSIDALKVVTHPSTNRARRSLTLLVVVVVSRV